MFGNAQVEEVIFTGTPIRTSDQSEVRRIVEQLPADYQYVEADASLIQWVGQL